MFLKWGHAQLSEAGRRKIEQHLQSPRFTAAASRILNDESRKIQHIAEELARGEIHRRPEERRTNDGPTWKGSKGKPHYEDSFEIVPANKLGRERIRAGITNTHPMARLIENGSPAHKIPSGQPTKMGFPFIGPVGKGHPGQLGAFAVERGDGPFLVTYSVDHPGTGAHKIMTRSVRLYRRRAQRILNQRSHQV